MDTSNSGPLISGFSFEKQEEDEEERGCGQDLNMFVTILFGDSKMELFNLNCKLIHFIHHLKERCGLDFKECVDLMDSSGRVMNLEGKQQSEALASSVLGERQYYVLLQVCRDDDTGGRKYVSLLNNYSQNHPELTELLRKLTNPEKERRTRGQTQRSKTYHTKQQQRHKETRGSR